MYRANNFKLLRDSNVAGKRVLIRGDLAASPDTRVPLPDDARIKLFVPTVQSVIQRGGTAVILAHNGLPNGKRDSELSVVSFGRRLSELMRIDVAIAGDCVGDEVEALVKGAAPGSVVLLENLRFNPGEGKNDPRFAAELARLGDIYVQDALSTCHLEHASVVALPKLMRERCIGLSLEREITGYDKTLANPRRPLCLVLGGARLSPRLPALLSLIQKVDKVIIGGGSANTFLAAQGIQMGRSIVEHELAGKVVEVLAILARRGCPLYLPVDFLVSSVNAPEGLARAVPSLEVPADTAALDIGPATSILFRQALSNTDTIIWNGTMGSHDKEEFANGTTNMVEAIAGSHAFSLITGEDTLAAVSKMGLGHKYGHISWGGQASLQLLATDSLPGLEALR